MLGTAPAPWSLQIWPQWLMLPLWPPPPHQWRMHCFYEWSPHASFTDIFAVTSIITLEAGIMIVTLQISELRHREYSESTQPACSRDRLKPGSNTVPSKRPRLSNPPSPNKEGASCSQQRASGGSRNLPSPLPWLIFNDPLHFLFLRLLDKSKWCPFLLSLLL